ncbi:MAG: DUF3987 domain-containing protein [Henriciella sp.]
MSGDAFRDSALRSIKADHESASIESACTGWPPPDRSLLERTEPKAPRLPISAFGNAAKHVRDAASGANAPPDYVAAMLFAAVGAILGKKCSVCLGKDWLEPVAPWSVIVGPPSSGKTPACKPIRQKLRRLERAWTEEHQRQLARQIEAAEACDASVEEISAMRAELNATPRLLVNDTTAEALARVELRAPDGLLVERDELAGLMEGLERYGSGGDRAFYLEAYDSGAFTIDRVKAGTLQINNHCFSVFGGIQPDRFRSLLTHSGEDDGFAARLLIFWPDPIKPTAIPTGADHSQMESALDRLDSVRQSLSERAIDLWPSNEAWTALNAWYGSEFAKRVGTVGKVGSAYGKLAGMAARLAGCLHLLDFAFGQSEDADLPMQIQLNTTTAALKLIEDYFVPQIQRAYHGTDVPSDERFAVAILNHCKANVLQTFNIRQARREWGLTGSSRKGAAQEFAAAADLLVDTGWVRAVDTGNRTKDFEVNPALFASRSYGA